MRQPLPSVSHCGLLTTVTNYQPKEKETCDAGHFCEIKNKYFFSVHFTVSKTNIFCFTRSMLGTIAFSYLYVTSSSRIGRSCGRFSPSPTTAAPTHSSARPPSLLRSPRNERAALAQLRCGCLDLRQHRRVLGIEQDTDAARLRNHLVQKPRPLGIEFGTKDAYPSRVPAWPRQASDEPACGHIVCQANDGDRRGHGLRRAGRRIAPCKNHGWPLRQEAASGVRQLI